MTTSWTCPAPERGRSNCIRGGRQPMRHQRNIAGTIQASTRVVRAAWQHTRSARHQAVEDDLPSPAGRKRRRRIDAEPTRRGSWRRRPRRGDVGPLAARANTARVACFTAPTRALASLGVSMDDGQLVQLLEQIEAMDQRPRSVTAHEVMTTDIDYGRSRNVHAYRGRRAGRKRYQWSSCSSRLMKRVDSGRFRGGFGARTSDDDGFGSHVEDDPQSERCCTSAVMPVWLNWPPRLGSVERCGPGCTRPRPDPPAEPVRSRPRKRVRRKPPTVFSAPGEAWAGGMR